MVEKNLRVLAEVQQSLHAELVAKAIVGVTVQIQLIQIQLRADVSESEVDLPLRQ